MSATPHGLPAEDRAPRPRHFPPPWTVHNSTEAYWVEDASGQRFGYCYFREDPGVNSGRLTRDEARRIAANIARLPTLLKKPE